MLEPRTRQVSRLVARARRIAVLTGSGISAESGIPTFRGQGGLWRTYRPEELATPQAFTRDPKLVWEWYDWRRGLISAAQPNAGHVALVHLEEHAERFTLVTQNVDGLHHRAGSRELIELHGNIWRQRCLRCGSEHVERETPLRDLPPRCQCGGLERPGVVWFGEALPHGAIEAAQKAIVDSELLIVVGTSAVVWPAAGLIGEALRAGRDVIEINPEPSGYSEHTLYLQGKAGEVLPALL